MSSKEILGRALVYQCLYSSAKIFTELEASEYELFPHKKRNLSCDYREILSFTRSNG